MSSENIDASIELLNEITEDSSVPKNIKQTCEKVREILESETEDKVKIDNAIQNLDLLADNASVPTYTRMQIWNIVSLLESSQNI